MIGRARRFASHRPLLAAAVVVALTVVANLPFVQVVGWARWSVFARRIHDASSIRAATARPTAYAEWSFAFRDRAVRLRVPLDASELARARDVDTASMFRARGSLRALYVKRVVAAQSESNFISGMADALAAVRAERGLDYDEYLELIARAVQSLPYGTREERVRLDRLIASLASATPPILAERGLAIVQSDAGDFAGDGYPGIEVADRRRWGRTEFTFLRRTRAAG